MKRHWRPPITILLVMLAYLFGPAIGMSQWSNKTYQQWDIADVEKVLNDSPWAQTKSKGTALGYDNPVLASGTVPTLESVTLRLRSALPTRQAILRLRQIRAKYDKMSDADKQAFDLKQKDLLGCPACADNYVITLSPPFGQSKGVPSGLKSIPFDSLKLYVQLANERGEKRELVHFVAPKNQSEDALFFFSRFNEKGEPLVTAANQKLIVYLDPKIFSANPVTIIRFQFDVPKMTKNGEVLF